MATLGPFGHYRLAFRAQCNLNERVDCRDMFEYKEISRTETSRGPNVKLLAFNGLTC